MTASLSERGAAVAAASAGLGLASARALLAAGARVAICGRDPDRLESARVDLSNHGEVVAVRADVSTRDGAEGFVLDARDALGAIDILVTNAGGPPPGTFATTTLEDYADAIDLNLLSTVAMCRAAVPAMRERRWGRVIAITSVGVRQPIGSLMASVTARAGVTGFLKVLATEIASDGVTVNSVQPGVHLTDRLRRLDRSAREALEADIPTATLGDPDDFGAVVTFLAGDHARFITGAAIPVDGGTSRALL